MDINQLTKENFWSLDLEEIESTFLPSGVKITDLPTRLDKRVPSQGSVLLGGTVNIDHVVKKPSFLSRINAILT